MTKDNEKVGLCRIFRTARFSGIRGVLGLWKMSPESREGMPSPTELLSSDDVPRPNFKVKRTRLMIRLGGCGIESIDAAGTRFPGAIRRFPVEVV